jgi:hypothetical protein
MKHPYQGESKGIDLKKVLQGLLQGSENNLK